MALAVDTTTSNVATGTDTSTHSHTCSGVERALVVTVQLGTGHTVNSITYNSVALTKITAASGGDGLNQAEIWYLVAPSTGANNVVVTLSGSSAKFLVGAVSFTGADQSVPFEAATKTTGTATTKTISITTVFSGSIVVDGMGSAGGTHTVGAGQTQIGVSDNLGTSYKAVASPGATTMQWDTATSSAYAMGAAEIIASGQRPTRAGYSFFMS